MAQPATAQDQPANALFFQQKIEPILIRRCLECHGSEMRGDLDLRTKAGALQGGKTGPALVPGNLDDSLLYDYVSTGQMPPKKPLPPEDIALLKEWIAGGGFFPDRTLDPYAFSTERRAGYDWWSLQPVRKPALPATVGDEKSTNPIDHFIRQKLTLAGLTPSAPADRATYLRRVTFDLHGLPPSYEEIREFQRDTRPDAFERAVDRLLDSPRYGERWGRHWLDVVRFAESNGFERDRLRPNFWPYRDYVIDAFNRDLPFDQFVREQIAGDALRPGDGTALTATGFLVAGPKNDVGTISELEQLMTRQDELDEFVVATGTTFLGLTIGCARCHDHKFDPITARDYYSLTAVFSGLDRRDNPVAPREDVERHAVLVAAIQSRIDRAKTEIKLLLDPVKDRLRAAAPVDIADPGKLPMVRVERNEDAFAPVQARFVRFTISATTNGAQPCLDELEVFGGNADRNLALAAHGGKASASSLLPGYPIHQIPHLNDGKFGNSWSWISNEAGQGWVTIELLEPASVQRVVWGRDREGRFGDRLPTGYRIETSLDGEAWTTVSSSQRRLPFKPGTPGDAIPLDQVVAALSAEQRPTYDRLLKEQTAAEGELRQVPALPASYSVSDGASRPAFVLHRGNVRERREAVAPAALQAVPGLERTLLPTTGDSGPARRLRLANWIADSRNPLTARVYVNRVWHYHFGQGIVNTPSDFGFNGDRPSHPELLDWLAADFMEQGWKTKRLHRLIVLSDTYRQSSQHRPDAAAKDGGNRWLWRMHPRRLESEAIRDTVLQTSGKLNLAMGGPSFRLFEYRDGNVPDYVLLEKPGPETWRRATYMFNIRTFHEPLMTVFDCPDASVQTPRRERSTTALQALSLMNNQFVLEQSQYFAERVTSVAGQSASPGDQVATAYRLAFGRDSSPDEQQQGAAFVSQHGLMSLCRVLFNTNEFLYVK